MTGNKNVINNGAIEVNRNGTVIQSNTIRFVINSVHIWLANARGVKYPQYVVPPDVFLD